ncbi:MAG: hypothetical protein ACQERB_00905 [Promethearchaeati archaeon]
MESQAYEHVVKIYSKCPRVLMYHRLIGEYNLFLLFFCEDFELVDTITNQCLLYNINGVRKSNIHILAENERKDLFFEIEVSKLDQLNEDSPCGVCCKFCKSFIKDQCIGCPGSKYYKGPLR